MQTTLLSQKISRQLDKLNCKFLWGDTTQHRHCHIISWETITTPKEAGGLGLKSTRHMNMALLMDQAWRLQHQPSMLWAQVLKAKYFPHANLFKSSINTRASHLESHSCRKTMASPRNEMDIRGWSNYSSLGGSLDP